MARTRAPVPHLRPPFRRRPVRRHRRYRRLRSKRPRILRLPSWSCFLRRRRGPWSTKSSWCPLRRSRWRQWSLPLHLYARPARRWSCTRRVQRRRQGLPRRVFAFAWSTPAEEALRQEQPLFRFRSDNRVRIQGQWPQCERRVLLTESRRAGRRQRFERATDSISREPSTAHSSESNVSPRMARLDRR